LSSVRATAETEQNDPETKLEAAGGEAQASGGT